MKRIYFLFAISVCLLMTFSCQTADILDDPTDIYTYIKDDSASGITIVATSNPMDVRNKIAQYIIPETTYEEKKTTLYNILDSLSLMVDTNIVNAYSIVDSLNYMAIHYMQNLLQDIKSVYSPLKHSLLSTSVSADKQLRVYCWNENIGVPFSSYINVFQYFTKNKQLKTAFNAQGQKNHDIDFKISQITSIYKLKSLTSDDLYLANFKGDINSSQQFMGSTILLLRNDSLYFDYEGFASSEEYYFITFPKEIKVNCSYDYKKQQLTYVIKNENETSDMIIYLFNGTQFELKQD